MSRNPPEKCLSTWDQRENYHQNSGNLSRGIINYSGTAGSSGKGCFNTFLLFQLETKTILLQSMMGINGFHLETLCAKETAPWIHCVSL